MNDIRGCEFIVGQRGYGKTQYIKQRVLSQERRFLLYDHMHEFTDSNYGIVFYEWDKCIDYLLDRRNKECKAIYASLDATLDDFTFACRVPFMDGAENLAFICDEIDTFTSPISTPTEFKRLIHLGRHVSSSVVAASRRPANVSRDFTSQAKRYVCFRIKEPRDIIFLKSVVGESADKIRTLKPLEYLAFDNDKVLRGKLAIPSNKSRTKTEKDEKE